MRKQRAERLRFAVESLPPETRRAMLDGIKENRIVTGANTDRRGGVCPMLAADRNAFQVTPLAGIFATAWDHYTGTSFLNVTRRTADERDLKTLQSMLETSLALRAPAPAPTALERPVSPVEVAPAPLLRPDLAETSRQLTAAARIEVSRALSATGHGPVRPAPPRRQAAPAPAIRLPQPQAAPAPAPATCVASARAAAATVRPAPALPPAARAAGRAPASKTTVELDRERARAIIANQASTLRSRAWPRKPVAVPAPTPLAAPAAVPAPAPVAAPQPRLVERERDRMQELAARSGWAWLKPFSSYDDYEQTLTELGETRRGPGADDGGTRRQDTKLPEGAPS